MKSYKISIYIVLAILLSVNLNSFSQDNIISQLTITPQSLDHNPALSLKNKKWYIGFPFLSSVNVNAGVPWTLNSLVQKQGDQWVISSSKLYDRLRTNNVIQADVNLELIRFGFKIGKNGFGHFGITQKVDALVNLKKNTLGFFLKGNATFMGETYRMENSVISQMAYTEISLGYSHNINKQWSVGGRFKYLMGQTNVRTERVNASFYTDPENYNIMASSDVLIKMSSPVSDFFGDSPHFYLRDLFRNSGMAIDLGASYNLNDKFLFEASIVDLGFIRWGANVTEFRSTDPNAQFSFNGIDANAFFNGSDGNMFNDLLDSLVNSLGVSEYSGRKYNSMLNTKIYLGTTYHVLKKLDVSGLFRMEFGNKIVNPSFGVACTYKPVDFFNITIGNTFDRFSALGLGLGLAVNGGPFQFYLMFDNISGFTVNSMKSADVRLGINFVIKDKKVTEPVE